MDISALSFLAKRERTIVGPNIFLSENIGDILNIFTRVKDNSEDVRIKVLKTFHTIYMFI